tara:strand:- start:887 stop:4042 length:3156 start_codon:yes stop_codon:yes gene_type:complete
MRKRTHGGVEAGPTQSKVRRGVPLQERKIEQSKWAFGQVLEQVDPDNTILNKLQRTIICAVLDRMITGSTSGLEEIIARTGAGKTRIQLVIALILHRSTASSRKNILLITQRGHAVSTYMDEIRKIATLVDAFAPETKKANMALFQILTTHSSHPTQASLCQSSHPLVSFCKSSVNTTGQILIAPHTVIESPKYCVHPNSTRYDNGSPKRSCVHFLYQLMRQWHQPNPPPQFKTLVDHFFKQVGSKFKMEIDNAHLGHRMSQGQKCPVSFNNAHSHAQFKSSAIYNLACQLMHVYRQTHVKGFPKDKSFWNAVIQFQQGFKRINVNNISTILIDEYTQISQPKLNGYRLIAHENQIPLFYFSGKKRLTLELNQEPKLSTSTTHQHVFRHDFFDHSCDMKKKAKLIINRIPLHFSRFLTFYLDQIDQLGIVPTLSISIADSQKNQLIGITQTVLANIPWIRLNVLFLLQQFNDNPASLLKIARKMAVYLSNHCYYLLKKRLRTPIHPNIKPWFIKSVIPILHQYIVFITFHPSSEDQYRQINFNAQTLELIANTISSSAHIFIRQMIDQYFSTPLRSSKNRLNKWPLSLVDQLTHQFAPSLKEDPMVKKALQEHHNNLQNPNQYLSLVFYWLVCIKRDQFKRYCEQNYLSQNDHKTQATSESTINFLKVLLTLIHHQAMVNTTNPLFTASHLVSTIESCPHQTSLLMTTNFSCMKSFLQQKNDDSFYCDRDKEPRAQEITIPICKQGNRISVPRPFCTLLLIIMRKFGIKRFTLQMILSFISPPTVVVELTQGQPKHLRKLTNEALRKNTLDTKVNLLVSNCAYSLTHYDMHWTYGLNMQSLLIDIEQLGGSYQGLIEKIYRPHDKNRNTACCTLLIPPLHLFHYQKKAFCKILNRLTHFAQEVFRSVESKEIKLLINEHFASIYGEPVESTLTKLAAITAQGSSIEDPHTILTQIEDLFKLFSEYHELREKEILNEDELHLDTDPIQTERRHGTANASIFQLPPLMSENNTSLNETTTAGIATHSTNKALSICNEADGDDVLTHLLHQMAP